MLYSQGMDEAQIEQRLTEAQTRFREITRALRRERQEAVMAAREHGWSKYKIAAVLGVNGPTVDSIIEAAERHT